MSFSTVSSVCLVAFQMNLRPWMPLWLPWWQSLQSGMQRYWRPCSMWWASEGSDTPQTPQGSDLTVARYFFCGAVSLLFIFFAYFIKPVRASGPFSCSVYRPCVPGCLKVWERYLRWYKTLVVPQAAIIRLAGKLAAL